MSGTSSVEVSSHPVAEGPSDLARRSVTLLWAVATVLAIAAVVIVIGSLSTPAPEAGYLVDPWRCSRWPGPPSGLASRHGIQAIRSAG